MILPADKEENPDVIDAGAQPKDKDEN